MPDTAKSRAVTALGSQAAWGALARVYVLDYVTLLALAAVTLWCETATPFTKVRALHVTLKQPRQPERVPVYHSSEQYHAQNMRHEVFAYQYSMPLLSVQANEHKKNDTAI